MSEPPAYTKTNTVAPNEPPPQAGYTPYPNQPYQQPVAQQPMGQQQPMQHHATTVVMMGQQQPIIQQPRAWSTGVCGCFEDPMICLCVMCCPECYGCHLASKAGETCCLPCCVPGWMISLRAHIRGKHNIAGSICDDCCMAACCYMCTMCQLSREIDNINRGAAAR